MADDQNQRPYRSNDTLPRANPAAPRSGNDPLAELARLIGQNDPFAEYARDGRPAASPPAAPVASAPATDWPAQPAAEARTAAAPAPAYGRAPFGGAPFANGGDLYQTGQDDPSYPATQPGYHDDDTYDPGNAQHAAEQQDYYDDAPPSRRRMGVLVIAGIFALAVVGTAGAFGYRAIFGSSSASVPPPVIKADSAPSKIVPANKDGQSGKQITDRLNERGSGEKLVSREEQPVDIKDRPAPAFPPPQQDAMPSNAPALGSGVVGSEPKKVRTIAIHPDQQASASANAEAPPTPASAPARTTTVAPAKPAAPPRAISTSPASTTDADAEPAPRATPTRVTPPAQQMAAAPAAGNAPLSLSPDAPATRSVPARAPARSAAVAPTQTAPAGNGNGGSYAVQVSSQRSEAEAQAAFRSLQGKYPDQLGGKQPLIHKADLGAKGVYYRAMVGPFASSGEAGELCTALKAAGGQCIVQRN
jgi:hypothetical protein